MLNIYNRVTYLVRSVFTGTRQSDRIVKIGNSVTIRIPKPVLNVGTQYINTEFPPETACLLQRTICITSPASRDPYCCLIVVPLLFQTQRPLQLNVYDECLTQRI